MREAMGKNERPNHAKAAGSSAVRTWQLQADTVGEQGKDVEMGMNPR